MVTVRTHLWFGNDDAVEAAHFYAEHIPGSSVGRVLRAPTGPDTVAEIVELTVAGHDVIGLSAGPDLHLDESFSFYLLVEGQEEVDHYWGLLTADGGAPGRCGWCTDRFGVSWQVVPRELEDLCGTYSSDAELRTFRAMLTMDKIDVAALRAAHAGT
jgi:predicted 3-demethylubiquinone-9 3-methyltransferase (glyoxalase superfamily)